MNALGVMATTLSVLYACSSGAGAGANVPDGAACPNLIGDWKVASHCDPSLVGQNATIAQSNCALSFAPPFDGFTGTVSADAKLTLSGPQTCTGTAGTDTLELSCTPGTCTVKLTR